MVHYHRGQEQCTSRPPIPPYGPWKGLYHTREDQPLGNENLTVRQAQQLLGTGGLNHGRVGPVGLMQTATQLAIR